MFSFKNDYSEGAHPRILEALIKTNMEQDEGYGEDRFSRAAVQLIKQKLGRNDVDVHLLSGGTQTNLTAISAFLRPHEAVISASSGHIQTHETGAIEATGHKIISIETDDGKLKPAQLKEVLKSHTDEHMVKPKLVYISNSTEVGTIYDKKELVKLNAFCHQNKLILFMDGARLGSALCSAENDLKLSDLPELLDAFYIGGTKNGALLGEALVICRDPLKADFRFHMKQKGALLAKGRLLGIQFQELFRDDLYFELAQHANQLACKLTEELSQCGVPFLVNSTTNQIFPIFSKEVIQKLQEKYAFHQWESVDEEHVAIRLVTSWAATEKAVFQFIEDIKRTLVING